MNAKDYKKLASAKQGDMVQEVTLPSKAVWKMLEPPIKQFVMAGKLPASLAAKMAGIAQRHEGEVDGEAMLKELSREDLMKNLEFGRDLLLHCAVEPRISLAVPLPEDAIAPEDILPEDFEFLLGWVMSGGKSGEGLGTFRGERHESTVDSSDDAGNGNAGLAAAEH
jgi:hypothetical protein